MHGVLILDKPRGLSSATAVERVKRALRADRAGHGGTLDPLATGVLPVCLGAATKLAQYLLADDKAYEAEVVLGIETDTLDRTGQVVAERSAAGVTEAAVEVALRARLGAQDQVPPMFSAIKQGGVRLYHRARAGEQVERAARRIRIDRIELLAFVAGDGGAAPRLRIAVACTKGTYIRSLVADLGEDLGCGAHLAELRRTQCGRFSVDRAVTLEQVMAPGFDAAAAMVAVTAATDLPIAQVPEVLVDFVLSGVQFPADLLPLAEAAPAAAAAPGEQRFQLVDPAGALIAIAHVVEARMVYDRVFGVARREAGDRP